MPCPPPEIDWSSWATWSCLREDITPIATFVGAAIVALAALAQARTARRRHQEQTAADRERRITESFAKAVEQLGSDKLETRLGAIYTLERISRESEREYWPIMETLTAFVRERAPRTPRQALSKPFVQFQGGETVGGSEESPSSDGVANPADQEKELRPATDVQAILTVLGRRDEKVRKQDDAARRYLDLRATNLRGANLWRAHLEGATLWEAHLEDANLWGAHLEDAYLWGAHLEDAYLWGAHLEDARLGDAHLEGADLRDAHLEGANLGDAHLEGADLGGAHLKRANLGDAHLEGARLGGALGGAHLEDAYLWGAHLEDAYLWGAYLEGANLRDAHLEGAALRDAHLEGADLGGAHLKRAFALTQDQVNSAYGDEKTTLPEGLTRPAHWKVGPS